MPDRQVCNINFYLYIRFVCGFYHEFHISERVRWLARCYCCLACVSLITWLFLFYDSKYWLIPTYLITAEYLSYVLISLRKNNKYLLQYYKKMPLIDDETINMYKPMHRCLIGYILALFLFKFSGYIKYIVLHWVRGEESSLFPLFEFIAWCTNVAGRLPVLFIFALLYTRVRSMRKMLESNEFECRRQGRHHPRQFIQMYEAIMDGLEKSDTIVNLQLFIFILFSTPFFLIGMINILHLLKNNLGNTFDLLWFIMETVLGYSPLILSAILSDMISMEVQEMLAIIVERRIACNNERDRAEIQKLFQLVKGRPFEYSLWHVVPLNLRCLLSFISFSVSTIIAIYQVKAWF